MNNEDAYIFFRHESTKKLLEFFSDGLDGSISDGLDGSGCHRVYQQVTHPDLSTK